MQNKLLSFRVKVHESKGLLYEDLFSKIMDYRFKDFKKVKPHGNLGDRKNDGWRKDSGEYYQVYAPQDLNKNTSSALKKMREDFKGLMEYWNEISPVKRYYFVVNDSFNGVSPNFYALAEDLKKEYRLDEVDVITAKNLEDWFYELEEDKQSIILGGSREILKRNRIVEIINSRSISSKIDREMLVIEYIKNNFSDFIKLSNYERDVKLTDSMYLKSFNISKIKAIIFNEGLNLVTLSNLRFLDKKDLLIVKEKEIILPSRRYVLKKQLLDPYFLILATLAIVLILCYVALLVLIESLVLIFIMFFLVLLLIYGAIERIGALVSYDLIIEYQDFEDISGIVIDYNDIYFPIINNK